LKIAIHKTFECWGDQVIRLWIAEYIKQFLPNSYIILDDIHLSRTNGPYHLINTIDLPFVDEIRELQGTRFSNLELSDFDGYISTHHRQWYESRRPIDLDRVLFFDISGFDVKIINENWFPTFNPNEKLLEQYNSLHLPKDYDVIHINDPHEPWPRDLEYSSIWYEKNKNIFKDRQIVCTGKYLDGLNMTNQYPWLKILIMIKANNVYGSQSGFTQIVSIYRKRINTFVINYNYPASLFLQPPIVAYSNSSFFSNNFKKLYWYADNCVTKQQYYNEMLPINPGIDYWKTNSQYEHLNLFSFDKIIVSNDYKPLKVSFTRENCLVPSDTLFSLDKHKSITLIPNNCVIWGGWHGAGRLLEKL
jgi:hypothetical protein